MGEKMTALEYLSMKVLAKDLWEQKIRYSIEIKETDKPEFILASINKQEPILVNIKEENE